MPLVGFRFHSVEKGKKVDGIASYVCVFFRVCGLTKMVVPTTVAFRTVQRKCKFFDPGQTLRKTMAKSIRTAMTIFQLVVK
jgi:hypothetical protein